MQSTIMLNKTVIFGLIFFVSTCMAFQISGLDSPNELDKLGSLVRKKRQMEDLSEEYPPEIGQEEPSIWNKIINVAVRLFTKFMEWLNSS